MDASDDTGGTRRPYVRGTAVGLGLVTGAGIGTVLALLLVGAPGLALGAAFGAGLGLVAGAVVDQLISARSRPPDAADPDP